MDLDNSKKISKFQFSNWFTRKLKSMNSSKIDSAMRKLFNKFDTDKSNFIDRKEFKCVFTWLQ